MHKNAKIKKVIIGMTFFILVLFACSLSKTSSMGILINQESLSDSGSLTAREDQEQLYTSDSSLSLSKDSDESSIDESSLDESSLDGSLSEIQSEQTYSIRIGIAGDIMFHDTQLSRAYDVATDSFDFTDSLDKIQTVLSDENYTFANLETTLGGQDTPVYGDPDEAVDGYTGYPRFNSPDQVIDAIKDSGFDYLLTANNHSLDSGKNGLLRTLKVLDEKGISHSGTYSSQTTNRPYDLIYISGIPFAIVNYTYATNGLSFDGMDSYIHTLDNYTSDKIQELYDDIDEAKLSGARYTLVFLHFGTEYHAQASDIQTQLVEGALSHGASFVLGSHPHVLEPIQIYDSLDGQTFDEPRLAIFSLGNLLASQRDVDELGGDTDLGTLLELDFEVEDGSVEFTGFDLVPTYVFWSSTSISTIPLYMNTDDLPLTSWDKERISYGKSHVIGHLMENIQNEVTELGRDGVRFSYAITNP